MGNYLERARAVAMALRNTHAESGVTEDTPTDDERVYTPPNGGKQSDVREAAPDKPAEGTLSATCSGTERQTNPPATPCETRAPEQEFVCRDSGVLDDTPPADNRIDADEGSVGDMCPVCRDEGKISHLYLTLDGRRECLRCLRKAAW